MSIETHLPDTLFAGEHRVNLYYLHEMFRHTAQMVRDRLQAETGIDVPITAGMWGGSYLVADNLGVSRTNVVRLYSLVSLPQNTPLDEPDNFEKLMEIYRDTLIANCGKYQMRLVDPRWGEKVPCTNRIRPTTTLQMWDASRRVKFVRAFFVWNRATWAESIIYDAIRNIKQIKELLDIDHRPQKKAPDELKFMLQDVLIIYFTLKPALTPDFAEHAEPLIKKLFDQFIGGLHDPERIEELYHMVHSNALVYGYEEALEEPYRQEGLNIHQIEDWPVEKINFVPQELKDKLIPYLEGTFERFRKNLAGVGS
ncbi:MAG: hypothetical protein GWM98_29015 [Nitrospinaceae bacterium]|nr:hypothetical protein [Nitrospinaceae bacterium]